MLILGFLAEERKKDATGHGDVTKQSGSNTTLTAWVETGRVERA